MKNYVYIFLAILIAGCENTSLIKTSEMPNIDYTFIVDKNYQAVYRAILKQANKCSKNKLTSKMVVKGELFSDIKSADITISQNGLFHKNIHMTISIETNNNKTHVAVSNTFYRWNPYALAVKDWAISKSLNCPSLYEKDNSK